MVVETARPSFSACSSVNSPARFVISPINHTVKKANDTPSALWDR